MGSRLAVLAAVIATLVAGSAAAGPDSAPELLKRGLAEYKAGKYAAAASTLERAYKLEPKPEILFAWAQAERLLGDCLAAVPLYRQLLDQTPDLNAARLIRENLALCEKDDPAARPDLEPAPAPVVKPPAPDPAPEPVPVPVAPAPPPTVIEHRGPGALAITLIAGGTLGLGIAGGFFVASSASADASERARTIEDYEELRDRADSQRTISLVAGGVGVALIGVGVFQAIRHAGAHETPARVSVTTGSGRTSIWVTARW